jgi:hypothetical protein
MTFDSSTGNIVANATIKFEGQAENLGLIEFSKSNETGFYSQDLKNGRYRISVKHDAGGKTPYVYMGEIELTGGVLSHDIPLR